MATPAEGYKFPGNISAAAGAAIPVLERVRCLLPVTAISSFTRGFFGGLIGGIAYQWAPSWLQLRELPFAGAVILTLATILGVFEVWRVAQVRAPVIVRVRMLCVLVACLLVLLAVAGFRSAFAPSSGEESVPVRTAPRITVFC